ncbi:MAG TPA: tetratricopeptide repeat protein [Terriglobales bacterium]|nr:tetratricopeptide repeat protein [Terriglobales bacterium]
MLRRSAALLLLVSTLAWTQAPTPGCANLPRTTRPDPYDTPEQNEKKSLGQRLKDQFSEGCANVLVNTCWGDQGQPPANTPGAPESKDKDKKPPADKSAPQEKTQQSSPGESSSKPSDPLAFPEEQSRRAQESAQGGYSSSKQPYNPPPPSASAGDSDVIEMRPYDPHKAEKDVEVGDFYYKRGNYKAAINRYQEALELGPASASVTFKLADTYEKDKRPERAALYYREYVRQFPNGAQIADARAALQRLPNTENLKRMEVARGLDAGERLLAQKNYPDAVARFCDVAGVAPDNARALFRLAQALQALGEFAAAYQNYQTYLKLDPDGPFASAAQREVRRLAPQVQQGRVTSPSSETRP